MFQIFLLFFFTAPLFAVSSESTIALDSAQIKELQATCQEISDDLAKNYPAVNANNISALCNTKTLQSAEAKKAANQLLTAFENSMSQYGSCDPEGDLLILFKTEIGATEYPSSPTDRHQYMLDAWQNIHFKKRFISFLVNNNLEGNQAVLVKDLAALFMVYFHKVQESQSRRSSDNSWSSWFQ